MSGTVLKYSAQARGFVPRAADGGFAPRGLTVLSQRGGTEVVPPTGLGPRVLGQK